MTPIEPLLNLLLQAERERDEQAAACRQAAGARQAAVTQHEQLLAYRGDCEARWSAQFRVDGRMELVNCYRGFVERLNQAVDQQRRSCDVAARCFERALAGLRQADTRVAAVRRLIERRTQEARLAGERLEQKRTDEFAARAMSSRGGGGGGGVGAGFGFAASSAGLLG